MNESCATFRPPITIFLMAGALTINYDVTNRPVRKIVQGLNCTSNFLIILFVWCACMCFMTNLLYGKVHVGKDQEKVQSEKDSHSKNQGGKKPN